MRFHLPDLQRPLLEPVQQLPLVAFRYSSNVLSPLRGQLPDLHKYRAQQLLELQVRLQRGSRGLLRRGVQPTGLPHLRPRQRHLSQLLPRPRPLQLHVLRPGLPGMQHRFGDGLFYVSGHLLQ
jgi:hypothetical protein